MPTVRFTANIQRHVECPTMDVEGTTLRDVLDGYFRTNQRARGYVLDEQGRLRQHMAVFIDGRQRPPSPELAFGSTTGSLWVTEDGGDSWQTISSNLPPIHAIRFEKSA